MSDTDLPDAYPNLPSREDVHVAFAEIAKETGVAMRADFSCCQSCACARLEAEGEHHYGFYHAQDTDSAAATGVLYVAFSDLRAGLLLSLAFAAKGWFARWDGTVEQRIAVAVRKETFDPWDLENIPVAAEEFAVGEGGGDLFGYLWQEEFEREERRWAWIVIDNPIGVTADCGSAACRETALEDAARAAAEYLEDRAFDAEDAPSLN